MKRFLYIFNVLLLCLQACSSEENNLIVPIYEGIVIDASTGDPFPNINVSVTNGVTSKLSVKTDDLGRFTFKLNTEGLTSNYYIQIGNDDTENKQIPIIGIGKELNDLGIIKISKAKIPEIKLENLILQGSHLVFTGRLISDGFSPISEIGICYNVSASPTIEDAKIAIPIMEIGEFKTEIQIESLFAGTQYYFRPYAINGEGIGYGGVKTFTTENSAPKVKWEHLVESSSQPNMTDLTTNSVILKAYIAEDGGSDIIESGFCWDEGGSPSLTGQHKYIQGANVREYYNVYIDGLSPNTTYYVKPYAINERRGIGYGQMLTFTTDAIPEEYVMLWNSLDIDVYKITCESDLTYRNCEIMERGFCYSLNCNTSINDNIVVSNKLLGKITCEINNLNDGTTYYIKPYVKTSSGGVYYGIEQSATTKVYLDIKVVNENNKVIPDVYVTIDTQTFKTNSDGILNLKIHIGTYRIMAFATGYINFGETYKIDRNTKSITITMHPSE